MSKTDKLMSNHVHLVISAKNNATGDILRDSKKFTSKKLICAITEIETESRRGMDAANFLTSRYSQ